jgi:D-psicose/D-tagatose/L-ribulose 3-epimerase
MRLSLCNEVLAGPDFEDQCAFAAACGYDGLEIAPFTLADAPEKITAAQAAQIRDTVEAHGLVVTGLHWLLVKPDGLSLTDPDPAVRARTRAVMERLTGLCAELGGRVLVHGSPKQRAVPQGGTRAIALAHVKEGLAAAAEAAARNGVTYCLEPLSRHETDIVNTVAEAAAIVREIGHRGLATMIDCSAAGLSEDEPVADLIRRWVPTGLVAHVQVNDRNRRGPGQGEDRFAPILAALRETGYAGDLAVEPFDYVPDGPASAARAAGYLRGILETMA